MNKDQVLQRIGEIGIVPVIRAASMEEALLAVDAVYAGGIPVVELTMTIPDAPQAIATIVKRYGDSILAGAGTVTNVKDATTCIDSGASFLVSPGLSVPVLSTAQKRGVLAIPGAFTPTELMTCLGEGASAIKIFPCGSGGGPKHLKALRGPFPGVALIPTGGVNASNAAEYFAAGAFALGAGGELLDRASLKAGDTSKTTVTARDFVAAVQAARGPH